VLPEQAPVQPTNIWPVEGTAFSVTVVPTGNDWVQPLPGAQSMPAGLEETVPEPPTVTTRVSATVVGGGVGVGAGDDGAAVALGLDESLPNSAWPRPPPHPASRFASTPTAIRQPADCRRAPWRWLRQGPATLAKIETKPALKLLHTMQASYASSATWTMHLAD
jgi:hypothetical protein